MMGKYLAFGSRQRRKMISCQSHILLKTRIMFCMVQNKNKSNCFNLWSDTFLNRNNILKRSNDTTGSAFYETSLMPWLHLQGYAGRRPLPWLARNVARALSCPPFCTIKMAGRLLSVLCSEVSSDTWEKSSSIKMHSQLFWPPWLISWQLLFYVFELWLLNWAVTFSLLIGIFTIRKFSKENLFFLTIFSVSSLMTQPPLNKG